MAKPMSAAALILLSLLESAPVADSFSAVKCSATCAKDRLSVRRLDAPKLWAYGCDDGSSNQSGALHRCCLEKEICMRTCGIAWGRCAKSFVKCSEKACSMDDDCIELAEAADVLVTGGESHMSVCKAYRDAQSELCECVPSRQVKDGANQRLAAFYKAYRPDRLDEHGGVKDVEQVWKKWQGREPELYFELIRKYMAEAVDLRNRSSQELHAALHRGRPDAEETGEGAVALENDAAAADERAAEVVEKELERRLAEERQLAEEELARRQAEEELARKQREIAQLQAEKAAAVAAEDFLRAKALKVRLAELGASGDEL